MTSPRLTVVSGPTAVGKGTVVARLRSEHPEIFVSVSATTRPPRPDEVDGVHYLFVTEPEFDALIEENALLEWAVVHGAYRYGTPKAPVLEALAAGQRFAAGRERLVQRRLRSRVVYRHVILQNSME